MKVCRQAELGFDHFGLAHSEIMPLKQSQTT